MDAVYEDRFLVFALRDDAPRERPQAVEREVASCATYEDACRVRRRYRNADIPCVIRFVGPAGGGD
jgi:hypothetical protein